MKKITLFLIIAAAAFLPACDATNSSAGDQALSGDQKNAAAIVDVISAGMKNVSITELNARIAAKSSKAIDLPELPLIDGTVPLGTLYQDEDKGIKIDAELAPGASLDGLSVGIRFLFTLDNYSVDLKDGVTRTISGKFNALVGFETNGLSQNIIIVASTPEGEALTLDGGELDGTELSFKDLKLKFDISQTSGVTGGLPFSVEGTVVVNGVPVYVNSEIIEFLMGLV